MIITLKVFNLQTFSSHSRFFIAPSYGRCCHSTVMSFIEMNLLTVIQIYV